MSSIPYSGGTIYNNTFTGDSRAAIVAGLETALGTAGWSTISGAGTGDVLMKSAVTPASASNSIRMRLYDPGSGNCAQVTMKNDAGDRTSQIFYLLPAASKTFRVIACKYNYFIFTAGTSASREFLCGGTLYIPAFLETVITADLGFINGNAISDTDTTVRATFRTGLKCIGTTTNNGRFSGLVNGTLSDMVGSGNVGMPCIVAPFPSHVAVVNHSYVWHDDSQLCSEAMISWGATAATTGKVRGMIHNCMVLTESYAADDATISSYDSHAWLAITNSNSGTDALDHRGTVFVAVS